MAHWWFFVAPEDLQRLALPLGNQLVIGFEGDFRDATRDVLDEYLVEAAACAVAEERFFDRIPRKKSSTELALVTRRPTELSLLNVSNGDGAFATSPNAHRTIPASSGPVIGILTGHGGGDEICSRLALALLIAGPQRDFAVVARGG